MNTFRRNPRTCPKKFVNIRNKQNVLAYILKYSDENMRLKIIINRLCKAELFQKDNTYMIDFEQDMYEQIIIWCHNDFDGFIAKWNEGESRFYGYITGMAKRMLFRSRKIAIYTGWEFRKKDLDMYNDSFQIKLTENDGILTEITN